MIDWWGIWKSATSRSGEAISMPDDGWQYRRGGTLLFYPGKAIAEAHATKRQQETDAWNSAVEERGGTLSIRFHYEAKPFEEWEVLMSIADALDDRSK